MNTEKYERKTYIVDAVQVTKENLEEIAAWCAGRVEEQTLVHRNEDSPGRPYVRVPVMRPMNPRQTMAFVGDWVLAAGAGFKVYTDVAFKKGFDPVFRNPVSYKQQVANIGEGIRIGG